MHLFLPEIKELISTKDFVELKDLLTKIHAIDVAENFQEFNANEKILIFRLLAKEKSIEVFESIPFEEQSFLLENLKNIELSELLNEMSSDERVDLFQELSQDEMNRLFSLMKKEEIEDVKTLLQYPEGTAGSLMTTEFVEMAPSINAREALLKLQDELKSGESEHIYSSYVCDEEKGLIGAVDLQDLVLNSPTSIVSEIMTDISHIKVDEFTPDEIVADLFVKYDLLSVPVVNEQNQLLGMVVFDDIVDLIRKENTKEIYELGKMHIESSEEVRYSSSTSFDLIRRRAGWLIFLLVFDFLTGTVLKTYEMALSKVVALSFFIPMLLDTGGNAGAQVSVTIIRAFAIGDVNFKNIWKIVKKEIVAALFMSAIVGIIAALRAYLLQKSFLLAIVIGLTLSFIVILATLTGLFLPILSKKVGLDPAVLAGPITTSVVDILGLIIYFNVAIKFLPALRGSFI